MRDLFFGTFYFISYTSCSKRGVRMRRIIFQMRFRKNRKRRDMECLFLINVAENILVQILIYFFLLLMGYQTDIQLFRKQTACPDSKFHTCCGNNDNSSFFHLFQGITGAVSCADSF